MWDDLYTSAMEVAISDLRANLSEWLGRARTGEEVVVTDRGVPVAKLVGLEETAALLERLTAAGAISRPSAPKLLIDRHVKRPKAHRPISDIVSEQRGER